MKKANLRFGLVIRCKVSVVLRFGKLLYHWSQLGIKWSNFQLRGKMLKRAYLGLTFESSSHYVGSGGGVTRLFVKQEQKIM